MSEGVEDFAKFRDLFSGPNYPAEIYWPLVPERILRMRESGNVCLD